MTTGGREVKKYEARKLDYLPYKQDPDYRQPLLELSENDRGKIYSRLAFLYGDAVAKKWLPEFERILKVHYAHKTEEMVQLEKSFNPARRFSERDVALITYGDLLKSKDRSPLAGLGAFLDERTALKRVMNIIHILPFFPYSSDRGFSVTDFRSVDPNLGSWKDIEAMTKKYRIMFDGVFNHISSESQAFKDMLNGHPLLKNMAIVFRSPDELTPEQRKVIVRPRTSDILTKFYSINGPIWAWTTFSPDQIDLNFKNPAVLKRVIDTLLLYVRKGANLVRLDAATYLWAEPGTSSVHLKQTHEIIKLMRDVLNITAPNVALVTETNVPHKDNVAYFGDGYDEAQLVYNFTLPPLVLHTFYTEDTTKLSEWTAGLDYPSDQTTFFNILDTHDGVGLMGARGILSEEEISFMVKRAKENGAYISFRDTGDGQQEPYEINTTWFGALNDETGGEGLEIQARRFVASRSISLALRGVPGIYFHGLIGTGNDPGVVEKSGNKRDINRIVINEEALIAEAEKPDSKLMRIITKLFWILELRTTLNAFHPNAGQRILNLSPRVFALLRTPIGAGGPVLAITNCSNQVCPLAIPRAELGIDTENWRDVVRKVRCVVKDGALSLTLKPYDIAWLIPET